MGDVELIISDVAASGVDKLIHGIALEHGFSREVHMKTK